VRREINVMMAIAPIEIPALAPGERDGFDEEAERTDVGDKVAERDDVREEVAVARKILAAKTIAPSVPQHAVFAAPQQYEFSSFGHGVTCTLSFVSPAQASNSLKQNTLSHDSSVQVLRQYVVELVAFSVLAHKPFGIQSSAG